MEVHPKIQNKMAYHRPVLLNESIEGLHIQPQGVYVDLTYGGGGHSRLILEKLGKKGRLLAFDQDPDAARNVIKDKRLQFVRANFRYMQNFLRYYGIEKVDGVLADLGISSYQIDEPERGFTFRTDSRLDMRMDPGTERSAADVLEKYPEDALFRIFRDYGELSGAKRMAHALAEARKEAPLDSSGRLESVLGTLVPARKRSKILAQVFQAIRIEVNGEIEALKEMLLQTGRWITSGGRLVVISYHSLEDRLVKNYMRSGNLEGTVEKDFYGTPQTGWKLISRKVIVPGEDEIQDNSRARSAKLRIAEKI